MVLVTRFYIIIMIILQDWYLTYKYDALLRNRLLQQEAKGSIVVFAHILNSHMISIDRHLKALEEVINIFFY